MQCKAAKGSLFAAFFIISDVKTFVAYILLFLSFVLLSSCATFNGVKPRGVARIKHYDFYSPDLPKSFDGLEVAFISDLHYKSRFGDKRLRKLVSTLDRIEADVLLMGGDYKEGCGDTVRVLFSALGKVGTTYGKYAVLGNNDYESCCDEVRQAMARNGITLLEHRLDSLSAEDGGMIYICGIGNPFDMRGYGTPPLGGLGKDDFVIMLVHTPDYVQDIGCDIVDIAFAGHTHGGQVTLFGLYAPVIPSKYGQRFRRGLKYTDSGVPVYVSNGIGTSGPKVRMFAPSEIMVVTLHCGNGRP